MNVILVCGGLFASIGSLFAIIGVFVLVNMRSFGMDQDPGMLLLPIVFIGLGTLFAVMGFFMLRRVWIQKKQANWLRSEGREIWADLIEVFEDWSVQINGMPGLCVGLEWEDPTTRVVYKFRSEPVFRPLPDYPEGWQVKVFINPNDYTDYTVALNEGRVAFVGR